MASISTSVNSTSSLGNTALRGFGGMASGIDRDSIIEQMTLGTTTKINNQKRKTTQLQWKQEAYMGISDKIIDLTDKYASYSSTSNLKDPYTFAKNLISVKGKDEATRFVSATGSSSLVDSVSIKKVSQLATSSVRQSGSHEKENGLQTNLDNLSDIYKSSNLEEARLTFGTWADDQKGGQLINRVTLTFNSSYTDDNEKKHTINYTDAPDKLVEELNNMLKYSEQELNGKKIGEVIEFTYDETTKKIGINSKGNIGNYVIDKNSSALTALGYKAGSGETDNNTDYAKNGISIDEFNKNIGNEFYKSAVKETSALDYLTGKKMSFNYDGNRKDIELIAATEKADLKSMIDNGDSPEAILEKVQDNLQKRLDQAYGTGSVKVNLVDGKKEDGNSTKFLSFNTNSTSTISVTSNDSALLKNLELEYGESNKVNVDGKLSQFDWWDGMKDSVSDDLNITINGKKIEGLTKNSTVSDILSKINSTSGAGVKATYVDATGQFMLVSSETGAGRQITVEGELAKKLFYEDTADASKGFKEGQNAKIQVSYGNGVNVDLERASNTFNLEGLNVTVSGVFGGEWASTGRKLEENQRVNEDGEIEQKGDDGKWTSTGTKLKKNERVNEDGEIEQWKDDSSETVTFSAKADVDAAVEKVKSFFEDFNTLVTEINTQITTRPDNSYQPLTDEQKQEMDETSIENWETKAKQGLLYGDSAMRDLSLDVQGIYTKLMSYGFSYEDLEKIGITYSQDYNDGGTLVFDESKFRSAMESDPDSVAKVFTGGDNGKGLVHIVEDTFTPYATRYASKNGNSYGRLIEIAGTNKKPTTLMNNEIYKQIKEMESTIESLQERLQTEQDRYISQFTTMETLLNQFNTQSSYLSQLTA